MEQSAWIGRFTLLRLPFCAHPCSGGFIPWEFQSHAQIRGWLHPALFAGLYQLLRWGGLDNAWSVAVAPRLLQGVFAGIGDCCLFLLARRLQGASAAKWTVSNNAPIAAELSDISPECYD